MALLPALGLVSNVTSISPTAQWVEDDGWQGTDYKWELTVTVVPQAHGSVETPTYQFYDGLDVRVGMWIADVIQGKACKIINITSQVWDTIVIEVEDVDRYNILTDATSSGFGGVSTGSSFIFSLNDEGEPKWPNLATSNALFTANTTFFSDLTAKFRDRNLSKTFIKVLQSGHGFAIGDPIALSDTGVYSKAIADTAVNAEKVIGYVTSLGVPSVDNFTFRPLGKLIETNLDLTGIGNSGDLIYLSSTVAGTYTATKPTNARALYIKISDTSAIMLYGGGGSSSGGGTDLVRYVVNATAGEEVEVLASGASGDVTYSRTGNTCTFTMANGAKLISVRLRVAGTVPVLSQLFIKTGTGDMANTGYGNRWVPQATVNREDTGNPVPITLKMDTSVADQFIINNLPTDTTSHIRLVF